jgi:hypothetical protein
VFAKLHGGRQAEPASSSRLERVGAISCHFTSDLSVRKLISLGEGLNGYQLAVLERAASCCDNCEPIANIAVSQERPACLAGVVKGL